MFSLFLYDGFFSSCSSCIVSFLLPLFVLYFLLRYAPSSNCEKSIERTFSLNKSRQIHSLYLFTFLFQTQYFHVFHPPLHLGSSSIFVSKISFCILFFFAVLQNKRRSFWLLLLSYILCDPLYMHKEIYCEETVLSTYLNKKNKKNVTTSIRFRRFMYNTDWI